MVQRLRLASGLILVAYLVTHYSNQALGIVSLGTQDAMLVAIYPTLTSPLIAMLLLGALILHVGLALRALWLRRTLRMTRAEALQYALGFAVPMLLVPHVLAFHVGDRFFGADFGFFRNALLVMRYQQPWAGVQQAVLLLIAWVHACIGLRYTLAAQRWYARWCWLLAAFAILLPATSRPATKWAC